MAIQGTQPSGLASSQSGQPGQPALALATQGISTRQASLWGDAWRRLIKNKLAVVGGTIVLLLLIVAVGADALSQHGGYAKQHLADSFLSPNSTYWLGTDLLGRDFYTRIVYGARVSIFVGISTMLIASLIGVTIGSIAGFYAGWVDNALMRLVDIWYSVPTLFFAILIMTKLGRSVPHIIVALSLTSWPLLARLTRAQMLSLREKEYIKAARLSGGRPWTIIVRHLLPNSLTPIIVAITFGIPTAIFTEATLSLFGIGVNPPVPSWGQMVAEGAAAARGHWYLAFFPSVALGITMLSFTFLGDGIRDALDPRMNN